MDGEGGQACSDELAEDIRPEINTGHTRPGRLNSLEVDGQEV